MFAGDGRHWNGREAQGWEAQLSETAAARDWKDISPFRPSQLDLADIIHSSLSRVSTGQPQTLAGQHLTCSGERSAGCRGQAKKSIGLGLRDANLAHGGGIHANVLLTKCSRLLLIHGTELLAWCQDGSSSQASTARDRVGEMGWEGRAGPALTAASPGAQPLSFFLMLTSPCAALCVARDYKSYSNGEDYFYLLDSTTGKLIVIRGCKEWFTFPALGKIMTQVLHPQ